MAPTYTADVLSRHVTIATFRGYEKGMEPMLRCFPPKPAKMWATFDIVKYLEHEKPGKYGDEVQTKFGFVLEEQVKSEVWPERDGDAFAATMAALKAGQEVRLSYNHVYVTRTDVVDGRETSSKYPERGLTLLEPTAPSE